MRIVVPARSRGFSMIELMIAILIGSLLLIGITSLFSTTSNVNRMENGLARLQENGRFALDRIAEDVRMTSATRSMRKASEGGIARVSPDRPMLSYVDFGSGARQEIGLPAAPAGASNYMITTAFLMKGHECDSGCAPVLPGPAGNGADHYDRPGPNGGPIPAAGTGDGNRAQGSDVLTLRYLRGLGVPLSVPLRRGGETVSGVPNTIQIDPASEGVTLGPSRLVVLGDHATTIIVSVAEAPGGTYFELTPQGNLPNAVFPAFELESDPRVSDFDADFVTVSYYLRLNNDPNPDVSDGRMISSLIRRENGNQQAIAEGIERLDFLFHVEDVNGDIRPMDAEAVSLFDPALCPPLPSLPTMPAGADSTVCGWRSVRAVEVYLLANTVADVGALEEPYQYGFLNSGALNTAGTVEVACDPTFGSCSGGTVNLLPSGLRPGRMLRREFRTVSTLRNNAF